MTITIAGITYTQQGDGSYRSADGDVLSAAEAQSYLSSGIATQDSGTERAQTATIDGVLYERVDGEWVPKAGTPKSRTTGPQNLGAGVFKDETGYYTTKQQGSNPTNVAKTYITEAEAERLTNPQAGAANATAQGNLSARYAELQLAQRQLEEQIKRATEQYALDERKQNFYETQSVWERGLGNEQLALQKAGLSEQMRSSMVGEQIQIAGMMQQREIINAQMQQASTQFNAQMGFQVEQANVEYGQRQQEQVQQYARDIGQLSSDPGSRAALASYVLANTGYGKAADTEGVDLRTDESLTGLELALRNRESLMNAPKNPYTFTPTAAPQLSQFQLPPATATPAAVTFEPPKLPTAQDLLAQGIVPTKETASNFEDRPTTAEENQTYFAAAGVPAEWLARMPKMEEGGVAQGAFIAGDSSDGKENKEVIIPDFPAPGMTTVVPQSKLTPKMKAHLGKMKKMQDGGVFASGIFGGLDSDRTLSRGFLSEANRRTRVGTPWEMGSLPDISFESTPGFDPFVASLLQGMRSSEQGLPAQWQQRQAALLAPPGIRSGVVGRSR